MSGGTLYGKSVLILFLSVCACGKRESKQSCNPFSIFTGGEGQDSINSGGGDDTINLTSQAADGTDDINGGSGVDTIVIGAGSSFVFSTANSKLQAVENVQLGSGAAVTLTGQTEGFNVIGGSGAETIITSSGDDTINAGLGDDFIQAAGGADVINGGAGRDTVSYADVTGLTSHGEANVQGIAVNFSGESIADDIIDGVFHNLVSRGDNLVTGNFDPNARLASGTVQYLVDDGDKGETADDGYAIDTLISIEGFVASALDDFIVLGADAVTVDAGAGQDVIFSGTAADNINAGSGDDFVLIGSSSDHAAAETIEGGSGDDTIVFTSVLGETLVLSANVTGVENIIIADADGTITGETAENINASALTYGVSISGNDGNNVLTGTAFADEFVGNDGDDTFIVTSGDTVDGGENADTIIVNADAAFTDGQMTDVENAGLADGVTLTLDHNDVGEGSGFADGTISGVSGGATETLIVVGAALGEDSDVDFSTGEDTALSNVFLDYRGSYD